MRISSAAILGTSELRPGSPPVVVRDSAGARPWARPLSRWLAGREARALRHLAGEPGFPALLEWDGRRLVRSLVPGQPMNAARPADPAYFRDALRLLSRMHRRGIAHNDLAREPNWLVTPQGTAAIIDFQVAWRDAARGRLFRLMAREDLRHLLKHKRQYCPGQLTGRQRRLLDSPSRFARAWRWTLQPLGRRLRGWLARGA